MDEITEDIDFRNIKKKLRGHSLNKGLNNIQHLYTWNYGNSRILCYGWSDGLSGKENKHDLPPKGEKALSTLDNSDTQLLFGDLFILQTEGAKLCDFEVADYGLFYSVYFEGFDDCLTDDESDDPDTDDSELNDFIVISKTEEEEEEEGDADYNSSDELDEDINEY